MEDNALDREDYSNAGEYYQKALFTNRHVPSLARNRHTGRAHMGMSSVGLALGDLSATKTHLREGFEIYIEGQFIDSALDAFPTVAVYLAASGDEDLAVLVLAHAFSNPITEQQARQGSQASLSQISKDLAVDVVAREKSFGGDLSLEEVVAVTQKKL